jgi:hypothetical protein
MLRVKGTVEATMNYPSTKVSLVLRAVELPRHLTKKTSELTPPRYASTQEQAKASSPGARQAD